MTALNPANGVFAPKETIVSPGTPRRGATGSNAIVKRGKSKFLLPEFGVDLKELVSRYNSVRGIPFVLFDCLNYLLDEKGAPHTSTSSRSRARCVLISLLTRPHLTAQERWTTCASSPRLCETKT
jgi:hypothetical protein